MPPEAATEAPPASPNVPVSPDAPQSPTVEAPFNDAFSELNKFITTEDEPKPETKGKPDETKPKEKPDVRPPAKPDKGKTDAPKDVKVDTGKPEEKPDEVPEKVDETPSGKRPTPFQLVHKYEKELKEAKEQIAALRSTSPKDHPDFKAVNEQLEALKQRNTELESKIKFVSYKDSAEFKQTYEKPYVDAWIAGRNRISAMTVIDNPDTGETRAGKAEDFDTLMRIGNDDQAAEWASQKFGTKAALALYHRERVQELSTAADRAMEEYKTKGSDQEKQTQAQYDAFVKSVGEEIAPLWKASTEGPAEKYPQWSKPIDGDEKGNELLQRGLETAKKAFASFNPYDPKLNKEQRAEMVRLHATVFNKASWFDRLAYQNVQKDKQIKELQKQLDDYKASEPGAGTGKRGNKTGNEIPSWEEQLEATAT